jgi:phosphopantothenoylcysteine synthetase/decarboxylase
MSASQPTRVLYIVTCATLAAPDIDKLVGMAQDAGWGVCVIATPMATRFIDQPALEAQTGCPVRSDYKQPGTPDVLPPATAMVVGGASANTINKLAAGISDNLALGLLNEAIGLGLPVAVREHGSGRTSRLQPQRRGVAGRRCRRTSW